jgi:hypothetical protein
MSQSATRLRIVETPTAEELKLFARGVVPARFLGLEKNDIFDFLLHLIEASIAEEGAHDFAQQVSEALLGYKSRVDNQQFEEERKLTPVPSLVASVNDLNRLAAGKLPEGFEAFTYRDLIASVVHAERMRDNDTQIQAYSKLICMHAEAVKIIEKAEAKGQKLFNVYGYEPLMIILLRDVVDMKAQQDLPPIDTHMHWPAPAEEEREIDSGQAADLVAALQEACAIAQDRELKLQIQCNPENYPADPWYVTAGTTDSPPYENDWHSEYAGPRCKSLEIALECFLEAYREPPLKVSVP